MATATRPLRQLDDPEAFAAARRAFVEAALELLSHRDDLELSVAEVVRDAGWHNAAFYRVFDSKDRLLLAVAEEAVTRTIRTLEARVDRTGGARDSLRAWARVLLRLAATPKGAASIQAFALERHRFLRRFPDSDAHLVAPVKRVLTEALSRNGVPDVQRVADAAYELVMGQQATWIARRHQPTAVEVDGYAELVTRLLPDDA